MQEVFGLRWGRQAVVRKSQGLGPSAQKRKGPQTDRGIIKEDLTRKELGLRWSGSGLGLRGTKLVIDKDWICWSKGGLGCRICCLVVLQRSTGLERDCLS